MPTIRDKATRPKAAAPTASVRKINFGAITKKKEDTRTSYPVLPDPNGQLAIMAARVIERNAQLEAIEGALDIDKAEIKTLATPFYFAQASGKLEVASGVLVPSPAGEVLISFPNRYGRLESEAPLLPILGERTGMYFRQAFSLEIDGDKLPTDKAQELLSELEQLFGRYHASEALKVKEGIKPVPDFHTVRHTALSPEQNLAINQLCPIVAMIRTKPRPKEGA